MSAVNQLPPIRPGHPLYACRATLRSGDLMYGVPLVNQVRSQALLYWINGKDGSGLGRDFLPAWDLPALRMSARGNYVVWEKQTEGQGKAGLSARILVEEECKWVMQVWPSESPGEEWAPFTAVSIDPRLLNTLGFDPVNLGSVIQHCFRFYFGKSVRVGLVPPYLQEGQNLICISVWEVREGKWVDRERLSIDVKYKM